ncbi:MAG: hypothetical protein FJZ95_01625 [Chloroflexi bacterium]|nr:hypothetical protein [Chloroflexota bacterium]
MSLFDVYIAIDFSGSRDVARQKSSIAFAEVEHGSSPRVEKDRFSRFDVVLYLIQRIPHHVSRGKTVLCGFDFSYSFPQGLWHSATDLPENWGDMIRGMANGVANLPAIVEKPESNTRKWAEMVNSRIARNLSVQAGPFWGPGFSRSTNPGFPFSKAQFGEFRLVEKRAPGFKTIFQIGGAGSVGLQSLCGIPYLFHLQTTCAQQKVSLHSWPFDGWEPEGSSAVLVEWYPALYNRETKSHESDALACVTWARDLDQRGELRDYFVPALSDAEKAQAAIEGWVLGVL